MEVDLGDYGYGIDFHPSQYLVTVGIINGRLQMYRFAQESSLQRVFEVDAHEESCRAAQFIDNGRVIVSASADKSILATDVESQAPVARLENAHEEAINALISLTESTVASGDDGGCIKVWDTRQRSCVNNFSAHEDYISCLTFASDSMKLLGTSGDGTLSVCNLRTNKIQSRSEFSEEELLSIVRMKNGRKVICGTQGGNLLLYSWGLFADCSDRFVDLAPNSIDVMLKLDEDRVITGCDNGIISLVGILPNRIIQPIAEHADFPIEALAFSCDKKFLGSTSHDKTLKLWCLDDILDGPHKLLNQQAVKADSDSDGMDIDMNLPKPKKATKTKNASTVQGAKDFFADL